MPNTAFLLRRAASDFGQCAKAVQAKSLSTGWTPVEYERIVGFGIARDWIGWAEHLVAIVYSDKGRAVSDRAYSLNELTRFTFLWTATNALFARPAILDILDRAAASKTSELDRFRVLYQYCGLSSVDARGFECTLHTLLALPMHVRHFPWRSVNTPPTILEVIYYKYTVAHEQNRGLGKKLLAAAISNNLGGLDLPTLIYATRNWNVHGVLLSSSFRGTRKKFNLWIDTVNLALANVLAGSALALKAVV